MGPTGIPLSAFAAYGQQGQGQPQPPGGAGSGMDMAGGQMPSAQNPGGQMGANIQALIGQYDEVVQSLKQLAVQETDPFQANQIDEYANKLNRLKLDKQKKFQDSFESAQAIATGALS